jgi:serine/threonine protein kinase
MYGYFDENKNIYIILEVGTGGQFYHYLKKNPNLPESKVAFLIKQICDAIN